MFHYLKPSDTHALFQHIGERNYLLVCDNQTAKFCLPLLNHHYQSLPVIILKAGEVHKNMEQVEVVLQAMVDHHLNKKSVLVNLGGGVICDTGGFAASIFQRGIQYINVPTTLMAMVDAGFGGKTGVNHHHLKNYLGTFQHPEAVFILPHFLQTLPPVEVLSGFAEVIKHSLLSGQPAIERILKTNPLKISAEDWMIVIESSNLLKSKVVEQDFQDEGVRKTLNLGHTFGHALESLYLKHGQSVPHGYAVAAGLICALHLSERVFGFPKTTSVPVTSFLFNLYGKLPFTANDIPELIGFMERDKKATNSGIKLCLLSEAGLCQYDVAVDAVLVKEAFQFYLSCEAVPTALNP